MKMNSQKKKVFKIVIVVLCCLAVIVSSVIGALYLFKGNDSASADYVVDDYNCFAEGFTDVLITDEKSAIEAVGSVNSALGIKDAESELEIISVVPIGHDTYYKMQQIYKGIPVYGKTVNVSANNTGAAMALTSNFAIIKDDLNITPTIAFEDLIVSLQPHLGASSIEVAGFGKEGLILFELTPNEYRLAYNLVANGINLIVDANTAEVLNAPPIYTNVSASVRAKDSDVIVTGWQNDDGSYHLYNDEYKISVFDVKGINTVINDAGSINPNFKDYTRNGRNLDTLYSKNGEFDDKAIILMDQSVKISSFYKNLGYEGFDQLHVAINDYYDAGNNARGGGWIINGRKCASILIGTEFNYNAIDVIAHEYTHAVSGLTVGWNGATRENSALNEAYSDIFGVLYENPQNPDWELTHLTTRRNFADPQEDRNYKHVSEIPSSEENYYKLSTIVSHTAYLMSNGIDGNNEMKIDATLLSELWYRSLHLLPSNAMFPQCRNAVELSARIMLKNKALSETQYECVVRAFDQTGIIHANFTNIDTVKNEFVLSVLSHQETENVSFNLAIFKKSSFDLFGWKMSYGNPEMIYDKNHTKGNVSLNLEDGVYIIRVTDNYKNESQPISVKIFVDGESSTSADEIVIQTDFWDVTTVLLNGNETSDDLNDIPDESEPIQIESFLSKKPFVDNKGEFAISFEYGFDTVEAWNGGTLTNFPQAMNDTFCITGDFDHDGIEDSVCSAIAADDDCTRFNFNVKTKDRIYVTDVCPSYANCDVYAYVIKGENEDYLVRESSAKRIVDPDDDESTEDYYLYETIFVYSIKSKTSISYEFFCNKQTGGYKFTTSGWDGSGHIGDLIYQSWENSDSKNQICDSESSAIEYIKAALGKSGLSERVMGNGSTNSEIIPICAVNKVMNSENQGTAILCTNENSKPQTSVDNNDTPEEGYAGNQTAEQLRKSIIGSWGMIGDYAFDTNGICYFGGDRNHPGTYKITENKKLIIDFPWTHNEYTWSELSFDEFHEDHDFDEYFWCITSKGVLRLNGSDYYRDGRIPLD